MEILSFPYWRASLFHVVLKCSFCIWKNIFLKSRLLVVYKDSHSNIGPFLWLVWPNWWLYKENFMSHLVEILQSIIFWRIVAKFWFNERFYNNLKPKKWLSLTKHWINHAKFLLYDFWVMSSTILILVHLIIIHALFVCVLNYIYVLALISTVQAKFDQSWTRISEKMLTIWLIVLHLCRKFHTIDVHCYNRGKNRIEPVSVSCDLKIH